MSDLWTSWDTQVREGANNVPSHNKFEFLIQNAKQPIAEHKLEAVYYSLFEEDFHLRQFGNYTNLIELIASKPNIYRKVSNDGRYYIHSSNDKNEANHDEFSYIQPRWALQKTAATNQQSKTQLQILKDGSIYRTLHLFDIMNKSYSSCADTNGCYITFGRSDNADIYVQHPSISRVHAIFQFANDGTTYLYDLNSTHKTKLNGKPIEAQKYFALNNKDRIEFGASSRVYVFASSMNRRFERKMAAAMASKNNNKNKMNNNNQNIDTLNNENKELRRKYEKQQKELDNLNSLMQKMSSLKMKPQPNAMQKPHQNSFREMKQMEQYETFHERDDGGDRNNNNKNHNNRDGGNGGNGGGNGDRNNNNKNHNNHDGGGGNGGGAYDHGSENGNNDQREKRSYKIRGIDFLRERDDLSRLTVVKLKYYTYKNGIFIGRAKKGELIRIIEKDIDKHFGL